MKLSILTPRQALTTFLKQKAVRSDIDIFKSKLIILLDKISVIDKSPKDESEEHLKNDVRDFLRDTYYAETNAINTKDKKDLVIHLAKNTDSEVGVIIEAKRPSNKGEMISAESPNKKALHEIILYYLDERNKIPSNFQLKQLVITNIYEWYIIDANHFDKYIYQNTQISNLYKTKINDNKSNPFFYQEVSKIIDKMSVEIPCVYFNIKEYDSILRNKNKEDDKDLIALYKILSPQHLLKIVTPNDSNSLNEKFYKELLHIIGLEEAKDGGKNIIRRKKENPNEASLIELSIESIKTENKLKNIPNLTNYGFGNDEQLFNISLELCITWINRILFIKLLEGQLVSYHQGNKEHLFLNIQTVQNFDELFNLFHKVLAINHTERTKAIKEKYAKIPYLNSSLFEINDLEDQAIKINSLDNSAKLEFYNNTILKDAKKNKKALPTLEYLLKFLDSYDFASEGNEDIQEENKDLINASVLGKIFEKINGYKDGSIYTPAFITMYMSRQSIRLAVVEKFNEALSKKGEIIFDNFGDIKNYTSKLIKSKDILKANEIVNSIHICDPAVGSGHFLVSALNEMICIKADLGILADENGNTINGYEIDVKNDELEIIDSQSKHFEYKINNNKPLTKELQRIQKTLFHEKERIIEDCLFGVDINPNSVKICQLRLWIELLKNAYYKDDTDYTELETLPNIDINIKCGNSLLSRFPLNVDLKKVFSNPKYSIETYKITIETYKNLKSKAEKDKLIDFIKDIKEQFVTTVYLKDPLRKKIRDLKEQLLLLNNNIDLFGAKIKSDQDLSIDKKRIKISLAQKEKELEEKENSIIYKNAFEWRFEFPEILNLKGEFEGFDVIIGNPPYIKEYDNRDAFNGLREQECYQGKMDIWYLFGDLGLKLLKPNYNLCYIATNNWTTNAGASNFRNIVINKSQIINLTDFGAYMIFENASIQTMIMLFKNNQTTDNYTFDYRKLQGDKLTRENVLNLIDGIETNNSILLSPTINKATLANKLLTFNTDENDDLLNKIKSKQNFYLREKADKINKSKSELGQGIVAPQDFVNKASAETLQNHFKNGDGIFVLSQSEFENKKFSHKEKEIIKPYYTTDQLHKYYGDNQNTHWIIYTKSDINKIDKKTKKKLIESYPKIKEHLDNFKDVNTSAFAPYGLHRAREQYFFEGEKIVVQRKCPKEPMFTYTNFDCYVSQTFFVIQSSRINLKYLTGLLNSKLVAFWLRKKGKMQGNAYQLDKEPLLEIPIYKPTEAEANKVAALVDKIILQKQNGKKTESLETQIDDIVCKLYDLTKEEIDITQSI